MHDTLTVRTKLGSQVVHVGEKSMKPASQFVQIWIKPIHVRESGGGACHRIDGSPITPQSRARLVRGLRQTLPVSQSRQLAFNHTILIGLWGHRADLRDHESEVVRTTFPVGKSSLKLGQCCLRSPISLSSRLVCLIGSDHTAADVGVQVPHMSRRTQKSLMVMLTVKIDKTTQFLGEKSHRGHLTIQHATRSPFGGNGSLGKDFSIVRSGESALDQCGRRTRAHYSRITALTQKQLESFHQRGLPRTGLTSEHRHT